MSSFYQRWLKRKPKFVWLTGLLGMLLLGNCQRYLADPAVETNTPSSPATPTLAVGATDLPSSFGPTATAVPSDLTPRQPPVLKNDNEAAWLAEMTMLLAELANRTEGDPRQMLATMTDWLALTDQANGAPWPENHLALRADLDDDGAEELLIGVPLLRERCEGDGSCAVQLMCGAMDCVSQVFFLEETAVGYTAFPFLPENRAGLGLSDPALFAQQDLDGDGRSELILSQNWCGAHTCGTDLWAGRWNGAAWEPLGEMGQSYTEISLADSNGDGQTEIVLYGGTVGSAGAGLQRPHTLIFGLENGRYTLQKDIPDPNDNPYFLLLDAQTALANGALDEAYALAEEARTKLSLVTPDEDPYALYDDWSIDRIGAYATIQMMLVEALRGETAVLSTHLSEIEARYNWTDNPYLPAAQALWQTVQTSGDIFAACQAMADVLRNDPEQAALLSWFGYNMEQIPPEAYCPLSQ